MIKGKQNESLHLYVFIIKEDFGLAEMLNSKPNY